MSNVMLGEILTGYEQRDAIHVAVAPVKASVQLRPGQHVGLVGDGMEVGPTPKPIGIIDPFLKGYVAPGEWCYLFLYPNTVASLRHDWTHPAFPASVTVPALETSASEKWLRELADECGLAYNDLLRQIPSGRIHTGDNEMYGARDSDDIARHYKNVTGVDVEGHIYFSCAC